MSDNESFDVGRFLAQQEALLVHFSTPMTRHEDLVFPLDLRKAKSLDGKALSFSTILKGDRGPYSDGGANAGGCIGIIIAPPSAESVLAVSSSDAGSYPDAEGNIHALGEKPSAEACRRSILERTEVNEWVVKDFEPVGIFAFPPLMIRKPFVIGGEQSFVEDSISLEELVAAFPDDRIFSANERTFLEYERCTKAWNAVSYSEILGA